MSQNSSPHEQSSSEQPQPQATTQSDTQTSPVRAGEPCPSCSAQIAYYESTGDHRCPDCGLVCETDNIDPGPEWRHFAGDECNRSRVGPSQTPSLSRPHELSTQISWRDQDANGNTLSGAKRERLSRLRTWNKRSKLTGSHERNTDFGIHEIRRMASALGLKEDVTQTASLLLRRAVEQDLLPGRSVEGIATAALYAAARQLEAPRTLSECETVSQVSRPRIDRAYNYLTSELSLQVGPPNPQNYLRRYASNANLSQQTTHRAERLLTEFLATGAQSGQSPHGIVAGVLYVAGQVTGESLTQQAIADACDVSTNTVRSRYQTVEQAVEISV
jgi:transcription initiation factor TFIIB